MKTLCLSARTISTDLPSFVMGIVNVTPDSFWENSRGDVDEAIQLALRLIDEGADIIDIGAESTRPGSSYVSEADELNRIVPVIRAVRKKSDVPISVDTRKFEVMRAAFDEGADVLNDVSALEDDARLAHFSAEKKIPVVLMHKRGTPGTMQNNTHYDNVFDEVNCYLEKRAEYALSCGIEAEKIILDVGIGFGKNVCDNVTLIEKCGMICEGKYKMLAGLSRKSFVGELTGKIVSERLSGTIAANIFAVMSGAEILRVHDVAETRDALLVMKAFSSGKSCKQS